MDQQGNRDVPPKGLSPAISLIDFEHLRRIRNTCRLYMTRNTSFLSAGQQKVWVDRYLGGADPVSPYLFYSGTCPLAVGYGMMSMDQDDVVWLSGGLIPDFRHKGLGLDLFRDLLERAQALDAEVIMMEVQEDNFLARRLYKVLGFEEMFISQGIVTMRPSPE